MSSASFRNLSSFGYDRSWEDSARIIVNQAVSLSFIPDKTEFPYLHYIYVYNTCTYVMSLSHTQQRAQSRCSHATSSRN